jgi:hypothetical protein
MLKIGDTGLEVRKLQLLLVQNGEKLTIDGWFGIGTRDAVIAVQRRLGLVVDGVAGPKTVAALQARVRPDRLLSMGDLARAADRLDVPLAAIRAVNEVEARGAGFLPDGRPKILFERHIMYRQLRERRLDADLYARQSPKLVSTTRGGYLGGEAEHKRLAMASAIHRDCAIEACSWGVFQIMGFHWQALGYSSAEDYAARMSRSEAEHLDAFVRFIEADRNLLKALRTGKWATFAAGYNGAAYKENLYDIKLARAFERYSESEELVA